MIDYRKLCAELADALEAWLQAIHLGGYPPQDGADADLITRARAALAQRGAAGRSVWTEGICEDGAAILKDGVMQPIEDVITALNAAELAQPAPEEPTDEELYDLAAEYDGEPIQSMRAALTSWGRPTITPIPVSERPWEREGFCDAEGRCWMHGKAEDDWRLISPKLSYCFSHCLPHWALPLPATDG